MFSEISRVMFCEKESEKLFRGSFICSVFACMPKVLQWKSVMESNVALQLLDTCMKHCGVGFHAEVGKFRFLNEMIKLVSPKYLGGQTAPAVKQRVLLLMHTWTVDYPRETKIKEAYDMLKKQGVIKVCCEDVRYRVLLRYVVKMLDTGCY